MKNTVLALTLLAAVGASAPAAAAETAGGRAATAVGLWIAAQGNEALREIRQELNERLVDSLKPLLPAVSGAEAPAAPAPMPASTPAQS